MGYENFSIVLQRAIAQHHTVNPNVGLVRFAVLGLFFLSLVGLAWITPNPFVFAGITAIAGLSYAFWLICTHDMVHHTLTGWPWFETIVPRLMSWPMVWPYGIYAELHRLHHGWNGVDLRDPERVQWTVDEYERAHPILRWYVRHQWVIDIVVLGGLGLILKTVINAVRFQPLVPRLRQQLILDAVGILVLQAVFVAIVLYYDVLLRYLIFWVILERVIGIIVQTRDHLEHYGLWGKASTYQITQLYACRNIQANPVVNWLMGGLPYHSVHHAFPDIPFNQLPAAFQQIQQVLPHHQLPLMACSAGYVPETINFLNHASLIDPHPTTDVTGRCQMIPL